VFRSRGSLREPLLPIKPFFLRARALPYAPRFRKVQPRSAQERLKFGVSMLPGTHRNSRSLPVKFLHCFQTAPNGAQSSKLFRGFEEEESALVFISLAGLYKVIGPFSRPVQLFGSLHESITYLGKVFPGGFQLKDEPRRPSR